MICLPSTAILLATQLAGLTAAAKTPVSSDLFQKFSRYTSFSSASYSDNCKSPPATIVAYLSDVSTDAFSTIFRDDAASELIVAFRGTATPQNFNTDLNFGLTALTAAGTSCSSCMVHKGFQTAYNALSSKVISAVNQQMAAYPGYSLTVTGHSLGGALASIASVSLVGQGYSPTVYTFGEPLNGNSAFTTYANSKVPAYFRVTHANDGVPKIPPTLLGYQHHGTEYWESANGSGNTASTTYQCTGTDTSQCNAGTDSGSNPINAAHISYTNSVIGSPLFIVACGAVYPA